MDTALIFPENLNLRFHHTGVACKNLDDETRVFEMLGYRQEGDDFTDEFQGISGRFLTKDGAARVELLVNTNPTGVLTAWLQRGVKMYHLAYEVDSLPEAIEFLVRQKARPTTKPLPAVAFGGREIVFLILPNLLLIELISRY